MRDEGELKTKNEKTRSTLKVMFIGVVGYDVGVEELLDDSFVGGRRRSLVAMGVLVVCCLLWGYSFPVMPIGTGAVDRHLAAHDVGVGVEGKLASRALFNGVRYLLAAGLYWVVSFRRQRGYLRGEVVGGFWVGIFFAGGMWLQVVGLQWALPSVSSFFTALAVVFAPIGQALLFRRRVGVVTWAAVGLAVAGMMMLSGEKVGAVTEWSLATRPPVRYLGEILTAAAAVMFSCEILALDYFGRRGTDAVRLTFVMLSVTGVLSVLTGLGMGGWRLMSGEVLGAIARDWTFWWTLISLAILPSVLAMHLMCSFQPRVSAATASVVYCTEPLFGTMFSLIFGMERVVLMTVVGGLAVVGSVFIVGWGERRGREA